MLNPLCACWNVSLRESSQIEAWLQSDSNILEGMMPKCPTEVWRKGLAKGHYNLNKSEARLSESLWEGLPGMLWKKQCSRGSVAFCFQHSGPCAWCGVFQRRITFIYFLCSPVLSRFGRHALAHIQNVPLTRAKQCVEKLKQFLQPHWKVKLVHIGHIDPLFHLQSRSQGCRRCVAVACF